VQSSVHWHHQRLCLHHVRRHRIIPFHSVLSPSSIPSNTTSFAVCTIAATSAISHPTMRTGVWGGSPANCTELSRWMVWHSCRCVHVSWHPGRKIVKVRFVQDLSERLLTHCVMLTSCSRFLRFLTDNFSCGILQTTSSGSYHLISSTSVHPKIAAFELFEVL